MLIHSVTPAHMLMDAGSQQEFSVMPTEFGYLEGMQTPQGFQISRVNSTDLSVYLKPEYHPGTIRQSEAHL